MSFYKKGETMRDIYIDKKELKLKYRPMESDHLLYFSHPELLLNSGTRFLKCQEGYDNSHDVTCSSIICKILLTNYEHDGIWLTVEPDKNKVSIPGGHLSEYELPFIMKDQPYTAIYETIVREMIEENIMLRDTTYCDGWGVLDALDFVIKRYGFNPVEQQPVPLLYSYNDACNEFIIYLVKEVDNPDKHIPALRCYEYKNMVWYTRQDHRMNLKMPVDRRKTVFNTFYEKDVRVMNNGVSLLDRIFCTENVFGKLNIY